MFNAEEIRVAMARRNMNIDELAEKAGINRGTVGLVVNDKAGNPRIDTLARIAKALDLDLRVEFLPAKETASI